MKTIYRLTGLSLLTTFIISSASAIEPIVLSPPNDTLHDSQVIDFQTSVLSPVDYGFEPLCGCEPTCGLEPTCGFEPACASGLEPACGCEPTCGCAVTSPTTTCRKNYVSLFGGWNFLHNYTADAPLPPAAAPASLTFDDGFLLGGALGRRFGSRLRGEVEFAFRTNSADTWNLTGATTLPNGGDADFYSIMFNSFVDLGTYCDWTPYIGGGIGIGFIDYNGAAIAGPANVSIQDEVFSYQGIVGISRSINSRIDLFSEYRYFGFNSADVEVNGIPAAGVTVGSTDVENVLFGMRMAF